MQNPAPKPIFFSRVAEWSVRVVVFMASLLLGRHGAPNWSHLPGLASGAGLWWRWPPAVLVPDRQRPQQSLPVSPPSRPSRLSSPPHRPVHAQSPQQPGPLTAAPPTIVPSALPPPVCACAAPALRPLPSTLPSPLPSPLLRPSTPPPLRPAVPPACRPAGDRLANYERTRRAGGETPAQLFILTTARLYPAHPFLYPLPPPPLAPTRQLQCPGSSLPGFGGREGFKLRRSLGGTAAAAGASGWGNAGAHWNVPASGRGGGTPEALGETYTLSVCLSVYGEGGGLG